MDVTQVCSSKIHINFGTEGTQHKANHRPQDTKTLYTCCVLKETEWHQPLGITNSYQSTQRIRLWKLGGREGEREKLISNITVYHLVA